MSLRLESSSLPRPHEKSIPPLTQKLMAEIGKLGYVIHPIIVDSRTHMIVDGTHRIEALLRLGIPLAPVYSVDYLSEDVRLETWARIVRTRAILENVRKLAATFKLSMEKLGGVDLDAQRDSLILIMDDAVFRFYPSDDGIITLFRFVEKLDREFEAVGLEYVRESELLDRIKRGDAPAGYLIPRLVKMDIIKLVVEGALLPPKSTRHIVIGRPMFIFCPLNILKLPIEEASEKFLKRLEDGRVIRLPPGFEMDRTYEEPLVVYYFEELKHLYPETLIKNIT
jgi:hypothetical protein